MPAYLCRTCGVQYAETPAPPGECRICADPRQYVAWEGQSWTTLEELAREGYRTDLRQLEPGLLGVGVQPSLAIGQRGLIVTSEHGNVLFDVPGFLDDAAIDTVERLGGLAAVSASHPHFYGVMTEWALAFDAELWLPEADAAWVTRTDARLRRYADQRDLLPGVTLIRCGGHFPGSAVLHWAGGADGRGVLLTGDTITVVQDRDFVSFMWSYPNLVPLDAATIDDIVDRVDGLAFDRVYGGWWGRVVAADAKARVRASAERYKHRLSERPD